MDNNADKLKMGDTNLEENNISLPASDALEQKGNVVGEGNSTQYAEEAAAVEATPNKPVVYSPFIKAKPPVTPATAGDLIFGALAVICSILAVDWALFGGFRLGFTIVYGLLVVLTLGYLAGSKPKLKVFPLVCGAFSLAAAGVFTVYNDPLVNFVLFATMVVLYCIMLSGLSVNNRFSFGSYGIVADVFRTAVFVPLNYIAEPFRSLSKLVSEKSKGKHLLQFIIGILLALPVIVVVVPLLVRSDVAFESIIRNVWGDFGAFVVKLFLGIILSPFLISLLFAHTKRLDAKKETDRSNSFGVPKFGSTVFVTFLSAISFFYVVYLISQLAYISSAFQGLLPKGTITAAEYARRGFFEMSAIAVINLILISFTLLLTKKKENGKFAVSTKVLCSFVSLFTLFSIVTAFKKMTIYIDSFGMTRLRILTSVFMVLLAIAVISLFIRLFVTRFPYMKAVIISCLVVGLAVSYIDIDTTIAKYNTEAYKSGKLQMDVRTLGELGDAAVPYLVTLMDDQNEQIRAQAKWELYQRYNMYGIVSELSDAESETQNAVSERSYGNGFSSYNMTADRANKLLKENYERFKNAIATGYPYTSVQNRYDEVSSGIDGSSGNELDSGAVNSSAQ